MVPNAPRPSKCQRPDVTEVWRTVVAKGHRYEIPRCSLQRKAPCPMGLGAAGQRGDGDKKR